MIGRSVLAVLGAIVLGFTIGKAFDSAGVTSNYDADLTMLGMFGGLGLGMILLAFLRGRIVHSSERPAERSTTDEG